MSNKLLISIYSHEDEFIELLYDSDREFEGQLFSPQRTINKNGTQALSFEIPIRIYDRSKNDFVENPRWDYIIHQYKIRIEQEDEINEFVCNGYTESRNDGNQVIVQVNCISLAEFELAQVGYSLTFGEETLKIYGKGVDPNDPGEAIPTYTKPDINFWERKLINYLNNIIDDSIYTNRDYELMAPWGYKIESWYPYEDDGDFLDNRRMDTRQFYEDDRIIGYKNGTDENLYGSQPIYGDKYEIKTRIISEEKSSIWNIQQTICEKFQCWPEFRFIYEDGELIQRLIVLKNELPENGNFTIQYSKNLKNLNRTVDSSQIITKMYVTDVENENVDSGLITIQDNEMNLMGENYLLDLDWYLGDYEDEDDNLQSRQLIKDDICYNFGKMYAKGDNMDPNVPLAPTDARETTNTKETYMWYKSEVGARNKDIAKKSMEMTDLQNKVSALIAEWEFEKANAESCLEAENKVKKEWEKCFQQIDNDQNELTINKDCFVKIENGDYVVTFNEKGISEKQIEAALKKIKSSVNLTIQGNVTEFVRGTHYEIYKTEQITGSVESIKLKSSKIKISPGASYAYFTITLTYSPLDFYTRCIEYWENKKNEAENRIQQIGMPSKEYLTKENKTSDVEILNAIIKRNSNAELPELEKKYYQAKITLQNAKLEKSKLVGDIEGLFSPFIKEGYWEESDFSIYPSQIKYYPEQPNEYGFPKPINIVEDRKMKDTLNNNDLWSSRTEQKLCFKIPDTILYDKNGMNVHLYDIANWNTIEVWRHKPGEVVDNKAANIQYVRGTDFEIGYGYTGKWNNGSEGWKVIEDDDKPYFFLIFPHEETVNTTNWQLSNKDSVYFRVKAKGVDGEWIVLDSDKQIIKPITAVLNNDNVFSAYCDLDRAITIDDRNIILSSIKVKLHTYKMELDNKKNISYSSTEYLLNYGEDYYSTKVLNEAGAQMAEVHLVFSNTTPLLHKLNSSDDVDVYYEIEYQTDATGSYYYKDAIDAMEDYKKPQVSYTVGIQDISDSFHFKKEKNFKPIVGTKVYIWDEEMHFLGSKGIIDSITEDLLESQNNQITITSYKNKFEDLFQKITAATVAVQNKEYSYDRASDLASTVTGKEKVLDLMTGALQEAESALSLSKDNDIVWDESGITVTNKEVNDNGVLGKLRITSNGLFVSNNQDSEGNYLWSTAITPDFINADLIRAGHLDTRSISIWNDTQPNFLWNEEGLCAYGQGANGVDQSAFVKYNSNGLLFRKKENLHLASDSITINNNPIGNTNLLASGMSEGIETIDADTEFLLNSKLKLEKNKKYFYCIKANVSYNTEDTNLDDSLNIKAACGISTVYKNIKPVEVDSINGKYYEINIQGTVIPEEEENFVFNVILSKERKLHITKWIIIKIDNDSLFGEKIKLMNPEISSEEFLKNNNWGEDGYHIEWDYEERNNQEKTNKLTLQNPEGYIDSVRLGWDGFRLQSSTHNIKLDETGLRVGDVDSQAGVFIGDLDNSKYGIRGIDKNGDRVFKLDEDGLEITGDIVASKITGSEINSTNINGSIINGGKIIGANIFGKDLNIGGFYVNEAYDENNVGYNFQVDHTGLLKARRFELYPRSGSPNDNSSSGIEKDKPFIKLNYKNNKGSLDFYNNSVYKNNSSQNQTLLAHFGEDNICFYDNSGNLKTLIEQNTIRLFGGDSDDNNFIELKSEDGESVFSMYDNAKKQIVKIANGQFLFQCPEYSGQNIGGIESKYIEKDKEGSLVESSMFSLFTEDSGRLDIYCIKQESLMQQIKQQIKDTFKTPDRLIHFNLDEVTGAKISSRTKKGVTAFYFAPGVGATACAGNMEHLENVEWDVYSTYNIVYNAKILGGFEISYKNDDGTDSESTEAHMTHPILSAKPKMYYTDESTGEVGVYNYHSIQIGNAQDVTNVIMKLKRRSAINDAPLAVEGAGFSIEIAEDDTTTPTTLFTINEGGAYYSGKGYRLITSENVNGDTINGGTAIGERGFPSVSALKYDSSSNSVSAYCYNAPNHGSNGYGWVAIQGGSGSGGVAVFA